MLIRHKILGSFLLVIFIFIALVANSVWKMHRMRYRLEAVEQVYLPALSLLQHVNRFLPPK